MKKSILAIRSCVLLLVVVSFLSCDLNVLNELLDKTKDKFVKEKINEQTLESKREENKEFDKKQLDIANDFENEINVRQEDLDAEVPVDSFGYQQVYPYSFQQEVIIDEKDLVPSTDEERKAYAEIERVNNILKERSVLFPQLISDACDLKKEYERLEVDLHDIISRIYTEVRFLSQENYKRNSKKINELTQLQNRLKIGLDLERLISQVDSIISELKSSEFFFNKAQETLTEAITKRLKNEVRKFDRYFFRGIMNNSLLLQLSSDSQRYARNALSQLESAAMNLIGVIGEKNNIENILKDAKSDLKIL